MFPNLERKKNYIYRVKSQIIYKKRQKEKLNRNNELITTQQNTRNYAFGDSNQEHVNDRRVHVNHSPTKTVATNHKLTILTLKTN